jgi:hypothetical protein
LVADTNTHKAVDLYLSRLSSFNDESRLESNLEDFRIVSFYFDENALESGFNKPLTFNFDLHLQREMRQVSFGLGIVNSVGARILTSEQTVSNLPSGDTEVSLVIRDHHLPPGNYQVTVGIDVAGIPLVYQEHVLTFEIPDLGIDNSYLVKRKDKIGVFVPGECKLSRNERTS